jgi:hypothetical protein
VLKTIGWLGAMASSQVQTDRLRDFFTMVRDLIDNHPEFKRLSPANIGCE